MTRRAIVVSPDAFAATAAGCVARRLRAPRGSVSVALAGGSTPRLVYLALAERGDIPWENLRIYFGDERAVPPDHADSNFRMARDSLLARVPIPSSGVFRMRGEEEDLEAAAREYEAVLPERLDVLILGIGTDCHTASLFPGSPALRETGRSVVAAVGPAPPRHRLTITPPVIRLARHGIVLAAGASKAAAVRAALTGPADAASCPAVLARRCLWVLDADAAADLPQTHPALILQKLPP